MPKTLHFKGTGPTRGPFRLERRAATNHAISRTAGHGDVDLDPEPDHTAHFAALRQRSAERIRRFYALYLEHEETSLRRARRPDRRAALEASIATARKDEQAALEQLRHPAPTRQPAPGQSRGVRATHRCGLRHGEDFFFEVTDSRERVIATIYTQADPALAALVSHALWDVLNQYDAPMAQRPARNGLAVVT